MYQQELFERFSNRGWNEHLGKGSFASVWGNPESEWVIKIGDDDGTRTYLEWVMLRTQQGKRMKGMPEIDWLVPIGTHQYMVAMKRLQKRTRSYEALPDYITLLINAFQRETGVAANDVYFNNILQDAKGNLVLTDPSSMAYRPLGRAQPSYDFELAVQ